MAEVRWLPLESNPGVMNKFASKLGASIGFKFMDVIDLSEDYLNQIPRPVLAVVLLFPKSTYSKALGVPSTWEFQDVFGFDPELLMMVNRPVSAVVLLYPISEKSESEPLGKVEEGASGVYFIKQTIGNACGTIGLIHALCNNTDRIALDGSKHLSKFMKTTEDMSPTERGKHLETDTAFGEVHEECALEGQTAAPSRDDKVDLHFVAFVHKDGGLYELDGRKDHPTRHGDTKPDTLLEDTVEVVKKFMARDPDNLNFSVVALAKA